MESKMEHLWAPWRLAYVASAARPKGDEGCFLCQGQSEQEDRKNLLVLRGAQSVVYLNRFPYNNGHLLVAPRAHKGKLEELDEGEAIELHRVVTRMVAVLGELMRPDGYNIGLNLGRAAGAGVPGHLHWHVVPRWQGDTNFMPVLAEVKVISQALDALYDLLRERLEG